MKKMNMGLVAVMLACGCRAPGKMTTDTPNMHQEVTFDRSTGRTISGTTDTNVPFEKCKIDNAVVQGPNVDAYCRIQAGLGMGYGQGMGYGTSMPFGVSAPAVVVLDAMPSAMLQSIGNSTPGTFVSVPASPSYTSGPSSDPRVAQAEKDARNAMIAAVHAQRVACQANPNACKGKK